MTAYAPAAAPGRRPAALPARRPGPGPGPGLGPGPIGGPPVPPPSAPRRITVVSEGARIDLALPGRCTIAELLPALVKATGAGGDTAGWALHRLAGPPLPPDRTVAASGLHDGEVLRLLPTGYPATQVVFDDFIDAVASNIGTAGGRWRPAWSRRVALVAAVAAFAGAATAAAAGPAQPLGPPAAALLSALLLLAGVLLSRRRTAIDSTGGHLARRGPATDSTAWRPGQRGAAAEFDSTGGLPARPGADPGPAGSAAGAALAAAGMPGLLAAVLTAQPLDVLTTPERLAAGSAAVAAYALLAGALFAAHRVWFLVAACVSTTVALAVATATAGGFPPTAVAAVLLVVAVLCTPAFPAVALRLATLPAPEVPADMAAFRAAEQPTPAAELAGRTRAAQDALTALLAGATLTVVLAGGVLLTAPDGFERLLTALGGLALLVRSRAYPHAGQRVALLTGSALLLVTSALATAGLGGTPALLVGAAALLTGLGCAVHGVRAGRRPPSPYWGRLLDVVDFVAVTALIPVAAAVLDLYGAAQALTG